MQDSKVPEAIDAEELLRRIAKLDLYPALRDAEGWRALRTQIENYLERTKDKRL